MNTEMIGHRFTKCKRKQKLSYRKQIACQLRTQYAEGIYWHKYYTVTLKSRLRVTEGHWKQNHWIDVFSSVLLLFHAGPAAIKLPSAEASKRVQCMSPGQYTPYIKGIIKTP